MSRFLIPDRVRDIHGAQLIGLLMGEAAISSLASTIVTPSEYLCYGMRRKSFIEGSEKPKA